MQVIKVATNTEPADTLAQRITGKLRAGGMVEVSAEGNPAPLMMIEAGAEGGGFQFRFQAVDHVAWECALVAARGKKPDDDDAD
jgi:stage V sporulation protein SpoVS